MHDVAVSIPDLIHCTLNPEALPCALSQAEKAAEETEVFSVPADDSQTLCGLSGMPSRPFEFLVPALLNVIPGAITNHPDYGSGFTDIW